MSTRERWIVYPLLFLTLGIALRDKILPPARLGGPRTRIEASEILVRQIHCLEMDGGQIVCAALVVPGPQGRPVVAVGNGTGRGVVETYTASGAPLVRLDASEAGGVLKTFGYVGKDIRELLVGHAGRDFGLFANLPALNQRLRAVLSWQGWSPSLSAPKPGTLGDAARDRKPEKIAPPTEPTQLPKGEQSNGSAAGTGAKATPADTAQKKGNK